MVPAGYRKREDGRLEPDPRTAPIVAEAFRRRANREPLSAAGRFLEGQGVRTGADNLVWIYSTVKRMIARRVYLGEVHAGPWVNPAAHEPLVDAAR